MRGTRHGIQDSDYGVRTREVKYMLGRQLPNEEVTATFYLC